MEKLPTWEECKRAIEDEEATCLHKFIYENEPVGGLPEKFFRESLLAVVNEQTMEIV